MRDAWNTSKRDPDAAVHALEAGLRQLGPRAKLRIQRLPAAPDICLCLLDGQTMHGPLDADIAAELMRAPPYWSLCWASGQVLAAWLLSHPERVAMRRVLDFGAGSGVVGIAAALAGASSVTACDIDPLARHACRENATLNAAELRIRAEPGPYEQYDLIVLADVLYDPENVGLIEPMLASGAEILIAEARLKNLPYGDFHTVDESTATTVPDVDEYRDFSNVTVYQRLARSGRKQA